jgi:hypothetical protein
MFGNNKRLDDLERRIERLEEEIQFDVIVDMPGCEIPSWWKPKISLRQSILAIMQHLEVEITYGPPVEKVSARKITKLNKK